MTRSDHQSLAHSAISAARTSAWVVPITASLDTHSKSTESAQTVMLSLLKRNPTK